MGLVEILGRWRGYMVLVVMLTIAGIVMLAVETG